MSLPKTYQLYQLLAQKPMTAMQLRDASGFSIKHVHTTIVQLLKTDQVTSKRADGKKRVYYAKGSQ
jgi:DNA-binding transcriptional regulator GbsR (MarR family)